MEDVVGGFHKNAYESMLAKLEELLLLDLQSRN